MTKVTMIYEVVFTEFGRSLAQNKISFSKECDLPQIPDFYKDGDVVYKVSSTIGTSTGMEVMLTRDSEPMDISAAAGFCQSMIAMGWSIKQKVPGLLPIDPLKTVGSVSLFRVKGSEYVALFADGETIHVKMRRLPTFTEQILDCIISACQIKIKDDLL